MTAPTIYPSAAGLGCSGPPTTRACGPTGARSPPSASGTRRRCGAGTATRRRASARGPSWPSAGPSRTRASTRPRWTGWCFDSEHHHRRVLAGGRAGPGGLPGRLREHLRPVRRADPAQPGVAGQEPARADRPEVRDARRRSACRWPWPRPSRRSAAAWARSSWPSRAGTTSPAGTASAAPPRRTPCPGRASTAASLAGPPVYGTAQQFQRYLYKYGKTHDMMAPFVVNSRANGLKFPEGYWTSTGRRR